MPAGAQLGFEIAPLAPAIQMTAHMAESHDGRASELNCSHPFSGMLEMGSMC